MKRIIKIFLFLLCLFVFHTQQISAENGTVKVLDIETSNIIKEINSSEAIDEDVQKAIKSIKRVTVQANPIPKKGYLIKIPLTKSIKIKNKWFEDIVSEVLLLYIPATKNEGKIILYNDENTPMFFDIEYDFSPLLKKLSVE
ncbi:hypothetical protein WQ54_02295 [Bacillus sp. SA1-12]|uniref:hypothetical protein n=1 Tax=Bacillus sp. SA1-12 TaxID=1455638 RepID=UPI0006266235|nr:hypothetical protein [Bacillus sp. SA1-12]KKI93897.1 hypothetical protein WQ54_02295 [Bacillus sp. SA1-12]